MAEEQWRMMLMLRYPVINGGEGFRRMNADISLSGVSTTR
jgi:hypothetical protein